MLFVTNRRLKEGRRSRVGRVVSFDLDDAEACASVFFCRRESAGRYVELMSDAFFNRLRRSTRQQILLYLHGFNCLPEPGIFPTAERLQSLCDELAPDLVEVVPLVWPCDDDFGLVLDYFDDQAAAEASGLAFARVLAKFLGWRDRLGLDAACLKHVNLLAHSMGNRVLTFALSQWARNHGTVPALFRSIFMVAADVANDCLDQGAPSAVVADAARNLAVYHAADDFALRSSKIINVHNKIVRRRLGHTGPADPIRTARNVVAVDCDAVNSLYDRLGHSYFLADASGQPGAVLRHIVATLQTGRIGGDTAGRRQIVIDETVSRAA